MKKLKTRLILAFVIMILLPIFLIAGAFFGFMRHQLHMMEKNYGIKVTYDSLSDNAALISRLTESDVSALEEQIGSDASRLLDQKYLKEINAEIKNRHSCLILRVDGEIVYSGIEGAMRDVEDTVYGMLPDYRGYPDARESRVYLGGPVQALVKQLDFEADGGRKASLYVLTSSSALMPQIQELMMNMVILAVCILALTSLLMGVWLYTSISAPLNQLKTATNNIKAGNLDFTVQGCSVAEINDLCEDFEDMRRRLKATTEEKMAFDKESKALISNISHDLKTPITAVKGYVEGIMDGVADTPEKIDRYIRTIYMKANEMDRLINELTFYSKIDTNRIPYTFSKIHIAGYFDDCAEELGMELENEGIELEYSCQVGADVIVIADVEQLKRVINNVIGNSIKYMDKEKQKIQIRLRDVGDFIQIEMEDNGRGIEAREVPYIFERFYRTDASRNSSKGGSGIGLSIVRKIVEDHGGKVWATSVEGQGTTIFLVLRKYQEVTAGQRK